jgi:alpha-L-rhamnosidase
MHSSHPPAARLSLSAMAVTAGLALVAPVALVPSSASAAPVAAVAAAAPITLTHLTTNGRVDPLGIPGAAPSLAWTSQSSARGVVQSAYQVRVAATEADLGSHDLWDSGRTTSAKQVDVQYAGPALTAATRYVWQVKVWDGAGQESGWSDPASFETGLFDAADWGDAEWIGGAAGSEVERWTDYTATYDFSVKNLVFGTLARAVDVNNGYMFQVKAADGGVHFRPHTKVKGGYALIEDVTVPGMTAADLLQGDHTMSVTFDGPHIAVTLDGASIWDTTDATFTKGFVGLRSSQATEGTEDSVLHSLKVTAKNGDVLYDSGANFADGNPFTGGTLTADGVEAKGNLEAIYRSSDDDLPLLRTEFGTDQAKQVASARVYATSRGIYELELNGEEVGDQHLAPGVTDYGKRIQHQTYDVTDQVKAGDNVLGAELADGWWGGKVGMWGPGLYGDDLSLLARLHVVYTDGTDEWIDSGDDWSAHTGPWTFTDNIDGESYDARREQDGWAEPGFDDSAWGPVSVDTDITDRVVPQPDEPVRTTEELATKARTEPTPGTYVYDLGQNMVGVARMELTGTPGSTVTVRYGEVLNPDGTLYTANLRAAKVTDHYTFGADGEVTYTPTFTQHGFRYVEITGATTAPATTDVTGVVWGSDLAATGTLDTSDAMLNQLTSNISWGQRGNFLSIPTDTPARDERLGWTGDINVFAPTASYLRDTRAFLTKWTADLRDSALANGNFPGIAPVPPGIDLGAGLGWSDSGITVPYAVYDATGDTQIVRENYDAMVKFMGFVTTGAGDDMIDDARGNWDDWLNLDDNTPTSVLGTAYFAEDARMLSEMAAGLGNTADAEKYAALSEDVRKAFTAKLIAPDGTVTGGSQTAYAMALGMDLVRDDALREKVAAKFVAKLAKTDNHLTTGFLGTPWLLPALTSIGRDDLAYTMLQQKDYPSWGYEIENGATTMWERWNSIMPDGSFGDVGMNSFNHYAYGAVGDWMYRNIGGISPLEAGYRTIRIAPAVGGGLTHGAGSYDSVYGRIATDWSTQGDDLSLTVDVPVGTTAQVVLPAANAATVTEGGHLLDGVDGVTDVATGDGTVTVTVGSGHYEFAVTAANAAMGEVLDAVEALQQHVGDLGSAGDLGTTDQQQLDQGLGDVHDDVSAALLAAVAGDDPAGPLGEALSGVRSLRSWLAASAVDAPVRSDLDSRLAAIESQLSGAVTSARGVTVALPPVGAAALPGTSVSGTVTVTNTGTATVTGVSGTVTVAGWDPVAVSAPNVPAGQSVQLPVTLTVPARQAPAAYDATLALSMTLDGAPYAVSAVTPGWLTVTSGLTLGEPTLALGDGDPTQQATLSVPITNTGSEPVHTSVSASVLPDGWKGVPSAVVAVPAGGTATASVPVVVPLDVVGGDVPVTLAARRGATTLVSQETTASLDLSEPADAIDHVDFGNAQSENEHALQASPSSGTNSEAGYTRRYANSANPGAWYSVLLDVPAGEPFVLRSRETFDGARTKKYHVYVDDQLVKTQLVPRAETGTGTKVYDLLVDDPDAIDDDGSVRVKFEYPSDASGYFDPSLADTWVLPVGADQAPQVAGVVTGGTVGDNGWFRSPAQVTVTAADDRDPAPVVETGESAGWSAYAGPVTVSGEGEHTLSVRATDAGGRRTTSTVDVDIDVTAPSTLLAVERGTGVEGSDRATLAFTATDALSGVARTLARVDGGAWSAVTGPLAVSGYGDHVVEFASTDKAGNVESMRTATVSLTDVSTLAAMLAPQVTGTPAVGQSLTATDGTWNTKGVTVTRQWLRDGTAIAGATGPSYVVTGEDINHTLAFRVTATKDGAQPATSTSAATAPVAKVATSATVSLAKAKVRAGRKVALTAAVPGATGQVVVVVDGRARRTLTLAGGTARTKVKVSRGKHVVVVRYLGSATQAASESAPVMVKGVRR